MSEEQLQQALEMLEKQETPQTTKVRFHVVLAYQHLVYNKLTKMCHKQGLMGMEFMKRGQKRRAEELQEAKEEWERDLEQMQRERDGDSDNDAETEEKAVQVCLHAFCSRDK
jgi:DNA mismatch repair ATPase MutL